MKAAWRKSGAFMRSSSQKDVKVCVVVILPQKESLFIHLFRNQISYGRIWKRKTKTQWGNYWIAQVRQTDLESAKIRAQAAISGSHLPLVEEQSPRKAPQPTANRTH